MSSITENLAVIKQRIQRACLRANRDPAQVKLIGVSKTVPADRVREGIQAGVTLLGENYVQEAQEKIAQLQGLGASWHFIGHLQSNKARVAVDLFDLIHTVDRNSLAKELNRRAEQTGRRLDVLLEVNVGEEASKSGASQQDLVALFRYASSLDGLAVRGLMALPPYLEDPEQVRPYFQQMRVLLDRLRQDAARPEQLSELSMGMSHDFEVAIEEGATFIRVGTALFGERLK